MCVCVSAYVCVCLRVLGCTPRRVDVPSGRISGTTGEEAGHERHYALEPQQRHQRREPHDLHVVAARELTVAAGAAAPPAPDDQLKARPSELPGEPAVAPDPRLAPEPEGNREQGRPAGREPSPTRALPRVGPAPVDERPGERR